MCGRCLNLPCYVVQNLFGTSVKKKKIVQMLIPCFEQVKFLFQTSRTDFACLKQEITCFEQATQQCECSLELNKGARSDTEQFNCVSGG